MANHEVKNTVVFDKVRNDINNTSSDNVNNVETFLQARASPEWPRWKRAILEELKAIYRNKTWKHVVKVPPGVKPLTCRWVFKVKPATEHEPERYKARMVAHGFRQRQGIDYDETFASVAKMASFRTLTALAANYNLDMTKLDVSNAFLHPLVDKDIYMKAPPGFPEIGVVKLLKALYGLKQAPLLWKKGTY